MVNITHCQLVRGYIYAFLVYAAIAVYTTVFYPLSFLHVVGFGLATALGIVGVILGKKRTLLISLGVIFLYAGYLFLGIDAARHVYYLFWLVALPAISFTAGTLGDQLRSLSKRHDNWEKSFADYVTIDEVTGMKNERQFREDLHSELSRAKRYNRTMSVLLMQMKYFDRFIDAYGERSEHVLKQYAARMDDVLRDADRKSYLGNGLFAIILPETNEDQTLVVKKRLQQALVHSESFELDQKRKVKLNLVFGSSTYPHDGSDTDRMIQAAKAELIYQGALY